MYIAYSATDLYPATAPLTNPYCLQVVWENDLELFLAEEEQPPPPPTLRAWWWQLSRAEKAMARLLGFGMTNWHLKDTVIHCAWAELCDEERAAAQCLAFDAGQWDAHAPERVAVPAPSTEQTQAARQWVAARLAQTREAELQFRQVCGHPFNAVKEPRARLEPAASDPDSPYFAALSGSLYDVSGPCELPPFVRHMHSRRTTQNPDGYCREHGCTFKTPINVDPCSGIWGSGCCNCAIGAPGLEPCDVCGAGLTGCGDDRCYVGVCSQVMRCYNRMCIKLEDVLSKEERAQEEARQQELTRLTGQYHYYPQQRHFKARIRGIPSDLMIVDTLRNE